MAMAGLLQGVFPPLVTPFTEEGAVDFEAFEANLAAYRTTGLAGALVLGSNGEAHVLETSEKLALIASARRGTPGTLLAGCGLESTAATISLVNQAADAGADMALVLPPYYFRARVDDQLLRRHYESIAEAAKIPILFYSVPAVTGITLSPALAASLAAHPRIAGVKESTGDIALLGRLKAAVPDSFAIVCGSGPVYYPALCLGARAGILAVACCLPEATVALDRAFAAADHRRARLLQEALATIATAVTASHGVPALKAAMNLAGLRGGWPRAPLAPVNGAVYEELRALVLRTRETLASLSA
jgi:4-hydroxy-2-oxoglutarate aldolase